ncbi:MAG: DUF2147 domain-containing protein [Bacteroidales bacterium]|nr:DUF2147 domain-containing protein [Bacteroidales bacterium]
MKKLMLLLVLALLAKVNVNAQSDDVIGIWLTYEEKSQIRIFKATNGKYYGKIAWLKEDPQEKDSNNPDLSLRDRPLMELIILNGFSYNEDKNQWEGGTIYDPKNGKTYDCYMWFEEDKQKLQIKGYVLGMKFIGRTTTWKREEKIREI